MQIRKIKTIHFPTSRLSINAMCWSNNNRRLAIADAFGTVHLFDENGEKKDSFKTKSVYGKKGGKSYLITSMVFSPDNVKLAVALSEHIIFIYRIGLEWGDKKSVCNKFTQKNVGILALTWPYLHPLKLILGRTDGEIKLAHLQSQKTMRLYRTESPVINLISSPDGHGFISGHYDGTIHRFYFKDQEGDFLDVIGHSKICTHPSIPTCISWGENIIIGGQDKRIMFYNPDGSVLQQFDYSKIPNEKEFSSIECNPSGQSFVISSFDRLRVFDYNFKTNQWDEGEVLNIKNIGTVTDMSWKPDGSRLAIGNMNGLVEYFDTCVKRYRYKSEFEFTFVNPSQVIVKMLKTGTRIVLKSLYGCEILKLQTRTKYLIGYTSKTLLLGDLETCKLSEVQWNRTGKEKYFFDNPNVCLVYNGSEISVVEYGINDIIGSFRTDYVSPHLISVRITYSTLFTNEKDPYQMQDEGTKCVAYLTDSHSIRILDLNSSLAIAKISNPDLKLDWFEMNYRATKLLYRDKGGILNIYDIKSQKRTTLLKFCTYVQWVPNSDVVVAQNRGDLCVWYSIDSPDRVTIVTIKGEVENIIRVNNCTAVVVNEGSTTVNYALNEGLIQFGTAMELKEYETAANILDDLSLTPETEAMWRQLAELVTKDGKYHISERCYAAIGDISRAKYLRKIVSLALKIVEENNGELSLQEAYDDWRIKAKIAILCGDFKLAEEIYVESGKVDLAMAMYEQVHKYEESIDLALKAEVPNAEEKKKQFIEYLIKTQQREKAAKMFEKEGKFVQAIDQYLRGGFPVNASRIVERHVFDGGVVMHDKVLDKIADKLVSSGSFKKAGNFFEKRQMYDRAIECYKNGHCYRNAVELASHRFPQEVVNLEEAWGDWLMEIKQMEGAINHFIEAKQHKKAMEAAIHSRQWIKAIEFIDDLDEKDALQYYIKIAKHYESIKNYDKAKIFFMKGREYEYCMEMFRKAGMLEEALGVAAEYLPKSEITKLYASEAANLCKQHKYVEAEKLYIKSDKIDDAIHMYSKNRMFDDMIRLVKKYRRKHLVPALTQIANQLESEKKYIEAEKFLIEAGQWKKAVNMYKKIDKWPEAIRVAKIYGGHEGWRNVCKHWATLLGGEEGNEKGAQLLYKYELYEDAIQYALERELFNFAFDIARTSCKEKLTIVHKEYAIYLEDCGKLAEAEEEYINAKCPKEAIDMYIHQNDYSNAMRVANTHDPTFATYVAEHERNVKQHEKNLKTDKVKEEEAPIWSFEGGIPQTMPKLEVKKAKPVGKEQEKDVIVGSNESVLRTYCQRKQFMQAMELVDELENVDPLRIIYSELYVKHLLVTPMENKYEKSLETLIKYGTPHADDDKMPFLYIKVVKYFVWKVDLSFKEIKECHDIMVDVEKKFRKIKSLRLDDFDMWNNIVHFVYMSFTLKDCGLDDLHFKCVISLLRYCDKARPDKLFFQAGKLVESTTEKTGKYKGLSQIFYNRFLDIYDAIEDVENDDKNEESFIKGSVQLENESFQGTDIPYEIPIPKVSFVSEDDKEEVTDKVLEDIVDVETSNKFSYPVCQCEKCKNDMYFGSLSCSNCKHTYSSCIVSGFPVFTESKVTCSTCHRTANRDFWNTYITKKEYCPYCNSVQLTK